MDILQYLIALLKTRKQIGIEGLGTLYKKKTPGRYDAETHSFLPPSYALEFTSEVLENTNLVEYIQNKRSISEDSARYFISQFVEEVQKGLQQGEYTLDNLGSFKITDDQLTFNPSQNINTGFDFFALPAVTAKVQQPQTEAEVIEEISDVTAESSVQTTEEPQIEQVQVPEFEHEMSKIASAENEIAAEVTEQESAPEEEIHEEEVVAQEQISEFEQELNKVRAEQEVEEEEVIQPEEAEEVNAATEDAPVEEDAEVEVEPVSAVTANEPTDPEVFEEITEVNSENPTNEPATTPKEEENDTWDFDNENVVSADDINQEETSESKGIDDADDKTVFVASADFNDRKRTDGIKLSATTHEWDFDTIENKASVEDNTLIGEFDNDDVEEEFEEEQRKMPLYQKLTLGLLVLLVVFAILYFVKPDIFENFKRDTTNPDEKIAVPIQRSNLKTQQDSISFADSIMKNAEKVGLDVQPAKDTLKVTTTKTEVKPTITYDIIAAAFAKNAEVEEYIAYMKKKGFEAKIANMPGKIYKKISIASYNNIDSAQKYLAKYRKQFKSPKMYVQPIKNN